MPGISELEHFTGDSTGLGIQSLRKPELLVLTPWPICHVTLKGPITKIPQHVFIILFLCWVIEIINTAFRAVHTLIFQYPWSLPTNLHPVIRYSENTQLQTCTLKYSHRLKHSAISLGAEKSPQFSWFFTSQAFADTSEPLLNYFICPAETRLIYHPSQSTLKKEREYFLQNTPN